MSKKSKSNNQLNDQLIDENARIGEGEQHESFCNSHVFLFLISFYGYLAAIAMIVMSVFGFIHITKDEEEATTTKGVEANTSLGCLSFIGLTFGILLFFSETKFQWFFKYFRFMRFRFGRIVLYGVSGTMMLILGLNLGEECDCGDYAMLIVAGIGILFASLFHIIGVFVFGAATAPPPKAEIMVSMEDPLVRGGEKPKKDEHVDVVDEEPVEPTTPKKSSSAWHQV